MSGFSFGSSSSAPSFPSSPSAFSFRTSDPAFGSSGFSFASSSAANPSPSAYAFSPLSFSFPTASNPSYSASASTIPSSGFSLSSSSAPSFPSSFGSTPAASASAFSLFGASSAASTGGSVLFGVAQSAASPIPSPFVAASSASSPSPLFGSSPFGTPAPSSGSCGSLGSSLFGMAQTGASFGSPLFGGAGAGLPLFRTSSSTSSPLFGAAPSASASASTSASTASPLFGASSSSGSTFGSSFFGATTSSASSGSPMSGTAVSIASSTWTHFGATSTSAISSSTTTTTASSATSLFASASSASATAPSFPSIISSSSTATSSPFATSTGFSFVKPTLASTTPSLTPSSTPSATSSSSFAPSSSSSQSSFGFGNAYTSSSATHSTAKPASFFSTTEAPLFSAVTTTSTSTPSGGSSASVSSSTALPSLAASSSSVATGSTAATVSTGGSMGTARSFAGFGVTSTPASSAATSSLPSFSLSTKTSTPASSPVLSTPTTLPAFGVPATTSASTPASIAGLVAALTQSSLTVASSSGEDKLDTSIAETTTSSLPASSVAQSGSAPSPSSVDTGSNSNEAPDNHVLVWCDIVDKSGHTLESNSMPTWIANVQHQPLSSPMEGSHAGELIEQLGKAISDVANAKREALDELIRRQKAEKAAVEANCRADALENSYAEELRRRRNLEEKLAKEHEKCERIENHRKDLEVLLENALKAYEELLANHSRETFSSTSSRQEKEFISEFSFAEIQEATDNFDPSLKIGEGDYGSMYKGFLRHTQVVIKMMCSDSSQGPSQFHQEVVLSSKFRHPNLVTLIGVCSEAWALVYEYLPNGSLEDRLSCRVNTPLSWQTRIRICIDTCSALIFLHSGGRHGMLHGDLKPENILLDANCIAKLCNFGLHSKPFHSTTRGEFSVEFDVFSFGIVLLRLLNGKAAWNLDEIVQNALDDGDLNAAFDQTAGNWPLEQVTELARLALRCCEIDCGNRPDLRSEVWPVLEAMRALCEVVSTSVHSSSEGRCQPPPSYFICPIKHEIMEDPHMAADGFTYEADAIRSWLNSGHNTSPMTNLQLPNLSLIPNQTLRSAIQEWLEHHQM